MTAGRQLVPLGLNMFFHIRHLLSPASDGFSFTYLTHSSVYTQCYLTKIQHGWLCRWSSLCLIVCNVLRWPIKSTCLKNCQTDLKTAQIWTLFIWTCRITDSETELLFVPPATTLQLKCIYSSWLFTANSLNAEARILRGTASFADKLEYKINRALVSSLFALMQREVSSWGKNTNHLSDQLEASRKLHTKHVALLLIDEPLLRRNSH